MHIGFGQNTVSSLYGHQDVYKRQVPEQTTWNSKVGYMPIWTEYRTRKNKTILEKTDFSLFGVSASLRRVAIAPNHKSRLWRNFQYECTQ